MSYTRGTSQIITEGLIFALDFLNPSYYQSPYYYSLVGQNKAELINSPSTEEKNNSIILNGLNQYLNLGNIDSTNPLSFTSSTSQTIDIWVNIQGTGKDYQRILDKSNGNNALNGYSLMYHPFTKKIYYVINNGSNQSIIGCDFSLLNQWTNIVIIKNLTDYYIYINKILTQQNTGILNFSSISTDMRIGAYTQSIEKCFYGSVNNIKIYDKALTSKEVSVNYEALKRRFIN